MTSKVFIPLILVYALFVTGLAYAYSQRPPTPEPNDMDVVRSAVFKVMPYTPERRKIGGTGFLIQFNSKHYIITNRHVCGEAPAFYLNIDEDVWYVAPPLAYSNVTDLCAIVPPAEVVKQHLPLALSERPLRKRDLVYIAGYPRLRPLTINQAHFLNIMREPIGTNEPFEPSFTMNVGRIDILVVPGNSGSPLLDITGDVIGVIFAFDNRDANGLFVPHSDLKQFLEALK